MKLDELEADNATQQAVEALVTLSQDSMDIIAWALSELLERLAIVRRLFCLLSRFHFFWLARQGQTTAQPHRLIHRSCTIAALRDEGAVYRIGFPMVPCPTARLARQQRLVLSQAYYWPLLRPAIYNLCTLRAVSAGRQLCKIYSQRNDPLPPANTHGRCSCHARRSDDRHFFL
jgi:hypothetical protein